MTSSPQEPGWRRSVGVIHSVGSWILVLGLGVAALLVVTPAPSLALFRLGLIVTEYGHWLAPALVAVVLTTRARDTTGRVRRLRIGRSALALVAASLLISPAVRASNAAPGIAATLTEAGLTPRDPVAGRLRGTPLHALELWLGVPVDRRPIVERTYSRSTGVDLRLDFLAASGAGEAGKPCVVVVHGGGWDSGSRKEFPELSHYLANRGVSVASIDYRLAPRHPWPAARDDVVTALEYLRTNAVELDIDPNRFVLLGRSAGAQVAAAAAYSRADLGVCGLVALYGPMDMHFAWRHARADDILDSPRLIASYLGGSPTAVPTAFDEASPIGFVNASTPPTLLLHGLRDDLVWYRQSERLAERLASMGVAHALIQLPWANHGFDYNLSGPGGQATVYAVEHFVAAVTDSG
ncbi:MAG: alpha/beta hydrolase fold domain-containing protein [Planctomycetota bacterium]